MFIRVYLAEQPPAAPQSEGSPIIIAGRGSTMRTGAHACAAYPVRPRLSSLLSSLFLSSSSSLSWSGFVVVGILVQLMCSSYDALGAPEGTAPMDQSEILRQFKASLADGGDPALADWNSNPSPPCVATDGQWRGVLCLKGEVWGLKLENMGLSGRIDVDALMPLRYLRSLSVMNNSFEGPMPDWRKLGALKALFLSNNGFSGEIAGDAFKGMTSLKKVYMANNRLTGQIPPSLESPKLMELHLENNQFAGRIPEFRSDHLRVCDVSNNQLEGPIPATLMKLDPTFFAGNKGLCGEPLRNSCPPATLPPSPVNDSSSGKSRAKAALIAFASILGFLLLLFLLVVFLRRGKDEKSQQTEGNVARPAVEAGATLPASHAPALAKKPNQAAAPTTSGQGGAAAGKLTFVNEERHKFDLQDLMRASAEVLGSGNFGASYKAVLVDGEALVVKRFKQMNNVSREDFHEYMSRLGRLKHPNLLPLVAHLYRREEKLLVFDYVLNGSLAKHLHGKHSEDHPGLNWPTRLKIIKGVAKGLIYIHNELPSLTVPHGHLKSSNVLLDMEFNPLLMDYALAPVVNQNQLQQVLVAYKSPEYANHNQVGKKTDAWCLGMLILEVLTGKYVIAQGCGHHGADLAGWIHVIVQEVSKDRKATFDKEMKAGSEGKGNQMEMDKLLQIGIDCCQEDVQQRLGLEEAVKRIEQVQKSASSSSSSTSA